jgi:hypothetical protein
MDVHRAAPGMPRSLRIFLSSPGDVDDERQRAALVIRRLKREFQRFFDISAVLWEFEPMLAHGHFQDIIEKPSETDIFVMLLWSRLGTELPDRYKGNDGRVPVTGTEWEFENALSARKSRGAPDLLVYRKDAPPAPKINDFKEAAEELEDLARQWRALGRFWERYFEKPEGGYELAFKKFRTVEGFELVLERDLQKLLRGRTTKEVESSLPVSWTSGSPFRGLSAFGPSHAPVFFGRSRAEREVVEALVRRADEGCAFLLVLGASGVGKSSLIQAGVLPTLAEPGVVQGVRLWRHCIFRPGGEGSPQADVFARLARALTVERAAQPAALREILKAGIELDALETQLRHAPGEVPILIKVGLQRVLDRDGAGPGEIRFVLLVDQLEEIFALPDKERAGFIEVAKALARCGLVWVVATMRSDFYPQIATLPELRDLAAGSGQYLLLAPRNAEIGQMIREPAKAAGLTYEKNDEGIGLDAVLQDAASNELGALPLLEFVLDELYRTAVEGGVTDKRSEEGQNTGSNAPARRQLTFAAYRELGSFEGAIAARADLVCNELNDAQIRVLDRILLKLVTSGEAHSMEMAPARPLATARTVPLSEFGPAAGHSDILKRLIDARLLVASESTVRVGHEALIERWPRLKQLVQDNQTFLHERDRIRRDRTNWEEKERPEDLLIPSGTRLREARQLLEFRREDLDPGTILYIENSLALQREIERRQHLRQLLLVTAHEVLELAEVDSADDPAQRSSAARVSAIEALVAVEPDSIRWLERCALAQEENGDALVKTGESEDAIAAYRNGIRSRATLREREPENLMRGADLCRTLVKLAKITQYSEKELLLARARSILASLPAKYLEEFAADLEFAGRSDVGS